MSIPNQNNLSDIIKSAVAQTTNIISEISKLQAVISSIQITQDTTKEFKRTMDAILMMLDCIGETMLDVQQAMTELNTLQVSMKLNSVIGNPSALIKLIRSGKIAESTDNSIFTQYVQLLEIAKQISELSDGVKKRDIKRSSRLIISAIDMMSKVFLRLVRNSIFIKSMNSDVVKSLVSGLQTGYRMLLSELSSTLALMQELSQKGLSNKKQISKGIRAIFTPLYSILNNMVLFGLYMRFYGYHRLIKNLVLFAGLATYLHFVFDSLTVVIDNLQKLGSNKFSTDAGTKLLKFIISSLLKMFDMEWGYYISVIAKLTLFDSELLPLLVIFFNNLTVIIAPISEMGDNYVKMRAGINALDVLLCGSRLQRSIINIIRNMDTISITQIVRAIIIITSLNIIFTNLIPVISLLSRMGDNYFNILKGRRALKLILLGGFARKSVIDIISSIRHREDELVAAIPSIILITTTMLLLGAGIGQLILMGKNYMRIKRGLKTLIYLSRKIHVIISELTLISKRKIMESILVAVSINILLAIMSVGMIALASVGIYAPVSIIGLFSILVVTGCLILLVNMLSKKSTTIRTISATKNLIEIIMILGAIMGVMAIITAIEIDFLKITRFALSMILIVGAMTAASWLAKLSPLVGLVKIILMLVPLLALAGVLKIISKYEFNIDNILGLTKAIACLIPIILSVSLIAAFVPLAVVGVIAMAAFVIGLIIIAYGLMLLAAIKIGDLSKAEENSQKIFEVCHNILDRLMNTITPKSEKGDGVFKKLVMNIGGPVVELIDSIFSIGYLVMMLVSVSAVLLIAGCLALLQRITLNPQAILTNVRVILNTTSYISSQIQSNRNRQNKSKSQPWWKKALNALPFGGSITDLVEGIINMGGLALTLISMGMIAFIAKNLEYLGNLEINRKKISDNVSYIIETANAISSSVNDSISTNENVANFAKTVDSTSKLINKVNGLNIDKIKTLAEMFGNAAAFAKAIDGNFDKLADVINEKIAPLIEDLKNAIADADKHAGERAKQNPTLAPQLIPSMPIQQSISSMPTQQPIPTPVPSQQPGSTSTKSTKHRNPLDEAVVDGVVKVVICDRNGNPK